MALATAKKAKKRPQTAPYVRLVARPDATDNNTARIRLPDLVIPLQQQVTNTPVQMGLDQAATVTFQIADPAGRSTIVDSLDADENRLLDGIEVRWRGLWWQISRIERTATGWAMLCQDRVAADLQDHDRLLVASREDMTRAQFVYRIAKGVHRRGGFACYIPELNKKEGIYKPVYPKAKKTNASVVASPSGLSGSVWDTSTGDSSGWGDAASKVRVKGGVANDTQLKCLNDVLTTAQGLGCSRRVMIAGVMTVTGETAANLPQYSKSNAIAAGVTHRGPFQQSPSYGDDATVQDTVKATTAFYVGRGQITGWKQINGSLQNGVGDLATLLNKVQRAGDQATAYFRTFEPEATRNVDLWLARNKGGGSTADGAALAASDASDEAKYYRQAYKFRTTPEGAAEKQNWWDATGSLADEVQWHRWAVSNTLGYATDSELIRGNVVLRISRDRAEVHDLTWTWDRRRQASEVEVALALEDPFQLLPGMVAMVDDEDAVSGRWLVDTIDVDPLVSNIATVKLRRRGAKKLEPAPVLKQREQSQQTIGGKGDYGVFSEKSDGDGGGASTGAKAVYDEAVRISQQNLAYSWGGGHERAGSPSRHSASSTGGPIVNGYDCSGYVYATLAAAGFGIKPGQATGNSGTLLSWGQPGRGKEFTVWTNSGHVFIEFHDMGRWKSADTRRITNKSGGPHVHTAVGETAGFTPRHWKGT